MFFIFQGGTKLFGLGLSIQVGSKLIMQWRKLFRTPHLLKSTIFEKKNFDLALFLGGFTAVYRVITMKLVL